MRYTKTPWGRFGGLLKTKIKGNTLVLLKKDAAVFARVLDDVFENPIMWAELLCLVWLFWTWVLDIMTALEENEFEPELEEPKEPEE